jgi:hypothetical protein
MKKVLLMSVASLILSACGQSTFTSPVKIGDVRDAIVHDLDFKCTAMSDDPVGVSNVYCARSDPGEYSPVNLAYMKDKDHLTLDFLVIEAGDVDRDKVNALMARFGFSADDVASIVEHQQRITHGTFTADGSTAGEINLFERT